MGQPTDIVIVVDDYDAVIGYKMHGDTSNTDRWRDSAVFIFNSSGDVLMAQRHKNKKVLPNRWGPAASGTVESHESYEQNAYKELAEEIGLNDVPLTHAGNYCMDYDTHKRFTGLFVGTWDGDLASLVLEENQVQAVKWLERNGTIETLKNEPDTYAPKVLELYLLACKALKTN
jgi:isopentenyldiphosphate isomerase